MPANLNDKYNITYENPYGFYVPAMDYVTAKVHDGEYFFFTPYAASVANGANLDIVLTTGAKEVHIVSETSAGGQCLTVIYADPTITPATGTAQAIRNRKESSANTPLMTVLINPTITDAGTERFRRLLVGGTGGGKVGSVARGGSESVIPANSVRLIRITNRSGGAADIGYTGEFYEE